MMLLMHSGGPGLIMVWGYLQTTILGKMVIYLGLWLWFAGMIL